MLTNLFKKTGWFYWPCSISGWIIFIIYAAVAVQFFIAIDRNSHSASDTLIQFFVYFMALSTLYWWIASNTCQLPKANS